MINKTFDDLIDVLIKAKKDNIVSRVEINKNSLNATVNLTDSKIAEFCISKDAGGIVFKERIDWINSLYTETFVIESEEDEMKIRQPVKSIILANGEEIINEDRLSLLQSGLCLKAGAAGNIKIPFSLLKGATVTQQKGNK